MEEVGCLYRQVIVNEATGACLGTPAIRTLSGHDLRRCQGDSTIVQHLTGSTT